MTLKLMMLDDSYTPDTSTSLIRPYAKQGGVSLPYNKPAYTEELDTRIIRQDPTTGEVYETSGNPINEQPQAITPPGPEENSTFTTTIAAPPKTDYKPLLIAGAVVTGLYLLSGK